MGFFRRRKKSVIVTPQRTALGGDIPRPLTPGRSVKPEEIRELGELIRRRYELDVRIWALRDVKSYNREVVEELMRISDAVLHKIYGMIQVLDREEVFESPKDFEKLQEIKRRIEAGGKRTWAGNPPWKDSDL